MVAAPISVAKIIKRNPAWHITQMVAFNEDIIYVDYDHRRRNRCNFVRTMSCMIDPTFKRTPLQYSCGISRAKPTLRGCIFFRCSKSHFAKYPQPVPFEIFQRNYGYDEYKKRGQNKLKNFSMIYEALNPSRISALANDNANKGTAQKLKDTFSPCASSLYDREKTYWNIIAPYPNASTVHCRGRRSRP